MLFGPGSEAAKRAVEEAFKHVRTTDNFNWTFIFILAVVFYIYWTEIKNKNYKVVIAGVALYSVHWFYEIMNAIIGKVTGYPLWTVSGDSSTFVLLIGVSWELSMMFSIAGMISYKMLGDDPDKRFFKTEKFKGISMRLIGAIGMALLFSVVEIFLAGTTNGSFLWVYKWWGAIPVFITTYIPFFLASNYIPDMKPKTRNIILIVLVSVNILLLAILVPLGII
ncbi:MAG: hypothetical protein K6F59_03725 [Gammaproteobacteria bacterium]|nr:hypothetical protein [Gammaproteobacteria bacterium]